MPILVPISPPWSPPLEREGETFSASGRRRNFDRIRKKLDVETATTTEYDLPRVNTMEIVQEAVGIFYVYHGD